MEEDDERGGVIEVRVVVALIVHGDYGNRGKRQRFFSRQ